MRSRIPPLKPALLISVYTLRLAIQCMSSIAGSCVTTPCPLNPKTSKADWRPEHSSAREACQLVITGRVTHPALERPKTRIDDLATTENEPPTSGLPTIQQEVSGVVRVSDPRASAAHYPSFVGSPNQPLVSRMLPSTEPVAKRSIACLATILFVQISSAIHLAWNEHNISFRDIRANFGCPISSLTQ